MCIEIEKKSPKVYSNNPYYVFVIFKGTSAQAAQAAKPRISTVEKRAFGSHMEEHKRQCQARNGESCF